MTRDEFRNSVFNRDRFQCVICKAPAVDAHHIMERRLFADGGYVTNNGASLCEDCHLKAEMTVLSVEDIRAACGIPEKDKVIPEHLYPDQIYDKWGNPILPNGRRVMGELFDDPSVQKILALGDALKLFSKYAKYPRTFHLPWSPGASSDDRIIKTVDHFKNREVVVTVKMDGENTSMYSDYIHARSLADKKHWSKSWIKNFHAKIVHDIPEGMRLVVENLYAKHSILYKGLKSYAYGISVWNKLRCLSWDESCEWFELLGIPVMDVLYRGVWDEKHIKELYTPRLNGQECEGYVVRLTSDFHYKDFPQSVAKYVRAGHVSSNEHWFYGNAGETNYLVAP